MTEPVGNHPRKNLKSEGPMSEIKGNSHKDRGTEESKTVEREPVQKIVAGKVVSRKTPWYKRFAQSMVAEDANHVGGYILSDVVIPATKQLILDMISQTAEGILLGTSRGRVRRGGSVVGRSIRDQFNYSDISRDREPRRISREARARHDFNEIVLEDRQEALSVLEGMAVRIDRYGSASVADMYDFVGVTGSHADRIWGWLDLDTAAVRQVPGGFMLDFPPPVPLTIR